MADFTVALRTRLLADSRVSGVTTKIIWGQVPQGTALPYVRLNVISDPRPEHLDGYDEARVTRVQADCFAATYGAARDLAVKIIAALGTPATTGGVTFGRIKAEGPYDRGEDVAGVGFVHWARLDLLVEHTS